MKKALILFTALFLLGGSFASRKVTPPPVKAGDVFIPIDNKGKMISLLELSQISIKDLQALTGRKMSLLDKAGFKLAQRDLRKSIRTDGTVDNSRLKKYLKKADGSGFHLGGFALGFLLGLIGVLIAYLIKDDKKKARVKWAWIGWVFWLAIWLIIILAQA